MRRETLQNPSNLVFLKCAILVFSRISKYVTTHPGDLMRRESNFGEPTLVESPPHPDITSSSWI